jgi:CRISPR type IV-associated DEAD/DEAH-box helicase Csf4
MSKKIYTLKIAISRNNQKSLENQVIEALAANNDADIIASAKSVKADLSKGKLTKLILAGENVDRIETLLASTDGNISSLIHGLIQLNAKPTHNDESSMFKWLSVSDRKPREGQNEFYDNLHSSLRNNKIGICESSTGSGKTAAILAALFDTIKGKGKRGLISTPAVALVRDFATEHTRLGVNAPPLRIFFGMNEFVSEIELTDFLDNWDSHNEQREKIYTWLENGAQSSEEGIKHCFLKHTLKMIAPDIPLEEVLLRDSCDAEDKGMLAYRQQFVKDNDKPDAEEILLCSHAMLAVDIRTRLAVAVKSDEFIESKAALDAVWKTMKTNKAASISNENTLPDLVSAQQALTDTIIESSADRGRIPDFAYAIIDEAHLLEQSFSNTLSNYVAIHQFTLHAKELMQHKILTKEAYSNIQHAYQALCNSAKSQENDIIHISQLNEIILSPLSAIEVASREGIKSFLASKKRSSNITSELKQILQVFQRDTSFIAQATHATAGQISYLNLSPRLAYPRLFVGKASVDRYLRLLWDSLEGAACVSATLYIPKADALSSFYIQSILAIPNERKQDFEPIKPSWIKETIASTYLPSCDDQSIVQLKPPSKKKNKSDAENEQNEINWCREVANKLIEIYDSAAGGCLVLMTSYAYVKKVKNFLMENERIAANLIFAQQGEAATKKRGKKQAITIDEQRRAYLTLAFNGQKPIWLALGNAWTGINLSGGDVMKSLFGSEIPAEEDNVLTDLIIPRLPFGINKSVTHTYRVSHKKKIPWERIDTLLRLRQGIGRLVRRHGVPKNRRIHILDARLCDDSLKSMMPSVKKSLELLE